MADKNCGKLDLSRISADDILSIIKRSDEPGGQNTGVAYVKAEVDEKTIVVLPDRGGLAAPGVYCVIKFNEGCFRDVCSDATDFNKPLALMSNLLALSLSSTTDNKPDTTTPATDHKPLPENFKNDPPTKTSDYYETGVTKTICGINIEKLKVAQNSVDTNSINSLGFQPAAIFPDLINIPMKSNIRSYGPFTSPAFRFIKGGADIVTNTELCPWNFGSVSLMNKAGQLLANNSMAGLIKAETGSVTTPGLPIINNLGAAVANGPYLTGMTVSFGSSGITTNYDFKTFNPKLAGLSRMSVERFKELRLARQEQLRFLKSDTINQNRINQKLNKIKNQKKLDEKNLRQSQQNTLQRVLVGELYPFNITTDTNKEVTRTVVGVSTLSKSVAEMTNEYEKKAYMSLDGIFGPVSCSGNGGLPRYAQYSPAQVSSTDNMDLNPETPFTNGSIIVNEIINNINRDQLNPLSSGHSIDLVGRETGVPKSGLMTNFYEKNHPNKYSSDYRFLALRGPVVLHAWGYDTDGRPIPNEKDKGDNAKVGNFVGTGLTEKFLNNHLAKPDTWPVAPIDLRYDRKRGVWVAPQSDRDRIITAKLDQDLMPSGTGLASVIIRPGDPLIYDKAGNRVEGGKITVLERLGTCYPSGTNIHAYFVHKPAHYIVLEGFLGECSGCQPGQAFRSSGGVGPVPSPYDTQPFLIGKVDLKKIPGWSDTKVQVLSHSSGCLQWMDTSSCPS